MHTTIDQTWFQASNSQRSVGALSAILMTVFFLLQFQIELKSFRRNTISTLNTTQLIWIPFSDKNLTKKVENELKKDQPNINQSRKLIIKSNILTATTSPTTTTTTLLSPDEIKKEDVLTAHPETNAISEDQPKLVFDSKSIRRAYEDSKTDIQKMAEASGKPLIKSAHRSQNDQFQSAANNAAKPDCIGPKSGGAGLLAIFIIPVMAAMDKCK